jgi:hypothetical protein
MRVYIYVCIFLKRISGAMLGWPVPSDCVCWKKMMNRMDEFLRAVLDADYLHH